MVSSKNGLFLWIVGALIVEYIFLHLQQWSHLEQNNFTIEEYIANKKAELNFEPVKNKVMKIQAQYNQMLIECLKNKSSI